MKMILSVLVILLLMIVSSLEALAYEVTYTYDDAGRLTGVVYSGANQITYTYDNAGNMLQRRISDPSCPNDGDVDGNGNITAQDAQQTFYIVLGLLTPTTEQECAADCNDNDSITAEDAQSIFLIVLYGGQCTDSLP